MDVFHIPGGERGGYHPIWMDYASIFQREYLKNEGVTELSQEKYKEMYHAGAISTSFLSKVASHEIAEWLAFEYYPPIDRGVVRVPHVHCDGKLYLLDRKQWIAYSRRITAEFGKRLSESKAINFEQLVELSDAMNKII
jgi:hypothetical protein